MFVCGIRRRLSDLRLTVSDRFNLWRHAPPGRRFEILRKVSEMARRDPPKSPLRNFDIGEFQSFEQFEIKYRQLAEELGVPGKIPAPGETDFLHTMVDRDSIRYPGGIGSRDYFFLTALVSILAPRRVIEIGTLTGFSTAIIAAAIHRQHGSHSSEFIPSLVEGSRGNVDSRNEITVETIDCHTHCIIDPERPVGFEIAELIPGLVSTVGIHTGRESDFVREIAARGEFGLAFIDADHRHPWPLLDVLRLAPFLQSGAWIGLHDIQLGTLGQEERDAGRGIEEVMPYGAEWLFARWPFRKIRSLHIGAIELPPRLDSLIPFALELMKEPFELASKAGKRIRRALYRSFGDLL